MPETLAGTRDPRYLLYRVGSTVASAVPDPVLFPAAAVVGRVISRVNRRRRAIVARNLARVVAPDELSAAVDHAFLSYARYWMEALRMPKPGLDEIRRRTTVEGLDALGKHIEGGNGVLFCGPHIGNWDIAGAWLASHGWRIVSVAEELEPPALYDMFCRLRRIVGVEVHPLGKASSAKALLDALRSGAVVGLLADRDIAGSGVEVEFFGERTWLPAGPAVLAMRTGASLAAGCLYHRPGGRYHGVVLDPIPVERRRGSKEEVVELTQRLATDFEALIRRDPGQWHLFQPNWPSDPGYEHPGEAP